MNSPNRSRMPSSSKRSKKQTNSNTFMKRIRLVLVLLIVTMGYTVMYMFRMAHSTSQFFHPQESNPRSALEAALLEQKQHSLDESRKESLLSASSDKNDEIKIAKQRQLAKEEDEIFQQQRVDADNSDNSKDIELIERRNRRKSKLETDTLQEISKDVSHQVANRHMSPQEKENHVFAKNQHNIFSNRHNNNHDPFTESAIDTQQDERTLKQQQAQNEALKKFQNSLPVVLDNPNRGGSGGVVIERQRHQGHREQIYAAGDTQAIEAEFALEDARQQAEDENNNGVHIKEGSMNIVHSAEKIETARWKAVYKKAVLSLQSADIREETDPLFSTSPDTPLDQIPRIPFESHVEYLGVLVDAGRHYFPISWWKNLIVYLYRLRFNLIQVRLTDDQAFNIQLESYPQLATPVLLEYNKDKKTYTKQEMQDLVQFAKKYNISLVPEINVPGHAGGWANIPGLVVMCPEFICSTGYGLPLNINHPDVMSILKAVIQEVLQIFDNPPFLHLGGDEVNMADPCFEEAQIKPFNYTDFERDLEGILQELKYPLDQVVRWERTGQDLSLHRAGVINHFWEALPGMRENLAKLPNGKTAPWFASRGLYFDTNHFDDGFLIHKNTMTTFQLRDVPPPKAIIAGTFELGTEFWRQRNVAARLIAVATGASQIKIQQRNEYLRLYNETCLSFGLDSRWCDLQGATSSMYKLFVADHDEDWSRWKNGICDRMTTERMKLMAKDMSGRKKMLSSFGYKIFWQNFGEDVLSVDLDLIASPSNNARLLPSLSPTIPYTGVLFDMVNSISTPPSQVYELLKKYIASLRLNTLQLRLVDDFGFAIKLDSQPRLGYTAIKRSSSNDNVNISSSQDYQELVQAAMHDFGIQVFPEISVTSNAGGWLHSGFGAACPNVLCKQGGGIASNIVDSSFLPVVYSVMMELRQVFNTSSLFHLGYDDRKAASDACLNEAYGATQDSMAAQAEFEEKLGLLTEMLNIPQEKILRWSNQENKIYKGRTGKITHYRAAPAGNVPQTLPGERFFFTINILSGSLHDIYKTTLDVVAMKPEGILAEIRDIEKDTWTKKNTHSRLAAFTMALTQKDVNKVTDEQKFKEKLLYFCTDHNIQGCDKEDVSRHFVAIEVEKPRYRDSMCSEFTWNAMARAPRIDIK